MMKVMDRDVCLQSKEQGGQGTENEWQQLE